jgi:hypothetical protein
VKAFDVRLPIIAKQAGVRTHHVFFTFHAMREMGALFCHQTVCDWTGLEPHHVTAIVDGLSSAKALPKEPAKSRATRLTRDFAIPETWAVWTKQNLRWSDDDVKDEAATFVNYWAAKPDGAKLDWLATWQNWCKRSKRVVGEAARVVTIEQQREAMIRTAAFYRRTGRTNEADQIEREMARPIGDVVRFALTE